MILKGASHVHSLTLVLCKPKKITAKGLNNSTVNSWWREKRPLPLSRMPLNQLLSKIMVALAQLQRGKGTKAYSQSNMTMVAMGKTQGRRRRGQRSNAGCTEVEPRNPDATKLRHARVAMLIELESCTKKATEFLHAEWGEEDAQPFLGAPANALLRILLYMHTIDGWHSRTKGESICSKQRHNSIDLQKTKTKK